MTLLLRYYNLNRFHLFLFIIVGNLLIIWLSKSLLINEVTFYNAYSEQLTYDRALQLFKDMQSITWVSYAISPVILCIKFSMVSVVLYLGIIFKDIQYSVALGSVFKIVIASEIVFLFGGLIKVLWFYFFAGNYSLKDISFFYPLSLINIFKAAEVEKIWVYPMQTVSLFHLAYLVLLSFGLNKICKIERSDSEKIVLLSYLPALILWVTLIMFLTMNLIS